MYMLLAVWSSSYCSLPNIAITALEGNFLIEGEKRSGAIKAAHQWENVPDWRGSMLSVPSSSVHYYEPTPGSSVLLRARRSARPQWCLHGKYKNPVSPFHLRPITYLQFLPLRLIIWTPHTCWPNNRSLWQQRLRSECWREKETTALNSCLSHKIIASARCSAMSGNERSRKINDTFDWILYLFTHLKTLNFPLKWKE